MQTKCRSSSMGFPSPRMSCNRLSITRLGVVSVIIFVIVFIIFFLLLLSSSLVTKLHHHHHHYHFHHHHHHQVVYHMRLPQKGDYYLIVFADVAPENPTETGEHVFKAVCEFRVVCDQPVKVSV